MIKNFIRFVKENLVADNNDWAAQDVVTFHVSDKLFNTMSSIDDSKVAKLLSSLKYGVKKENLVADPVDYLDIDKDFNVSFLKSRFFIEIDKWNNTRRVSTKPTKILRDIYNEDFLNSNIKQTDIEVFSNKLASIKAKSSGTVVEEFRGENVLRGYNYKKEFNKDFGNSCANFHQDMLNGDYEEPWVDNYDVYIKNPKNCGVVVVWDNGKIVARRSFQQGEQVCDAGKFKKGEFVTVMGNYYGMGGSYSKYSQLIDDYLKKKYNALDMYSANGFCIHMETRWKNYPAFDFMYVNFDHQLLCTKQQSLPEPYRSYTWESTYPGVGNVAHLHAPQSEIDNRIKEEELANKENPVLN